MLSHIDAMLKYAQRFYKHQFINRTELSGRTVTKFNDALTAQLHVSPRYLSGPLKQ